MHWTVYMRYFKIKPCLDGLHGVKDNDWIIILEYDALSHYTFFAFFIRTRNRYKQIHQRFFLSLRAFSRISRSPNLKKPLSKSRLAHTGAAEPGGQLGHVPPPHTFLKSEKSALFSGLKCPI